MGTKSNIVILKVIRERKEERKRFKAVLDALVEDSLEFYIDKGQFAERIVALSSYKSGNLNLFQMNRMFF